MKKTIIFLLIIFAGIFYAKITYATDNTWDISATTNDNVTAVLLNGTLTISGAGNMISWTSPGISPWFEQRQSITNIVIESGVTNIGKNAFFSNYMDYAINSIQISSSVDIIEQFAFSSCENLTSISIPGTVSEIKEYAFYLCENLETVNLDEGTTKIGNYTFAFCDKLSNLNLPNSITTIGTDAFRRCDMTTITIPANVNSIGVRSFNGISEILVNETNTNYKSINGNLFNKSGTQLLQYASGKTEESYIIPSSVTAIGYDAFFACNNLKNVTIPNNLTEIGIYRFHDCENLEIIYIPNTVNDIEENAFGGCDNITIYCKANSTAHQYAIENEIPYVLDSEDLDNNTQVNNTQINNNTQVNNTNININNNLINNTDNTISNKTLPKTGQIKILLMPIFISIIFSTIMIIKYNNKTNPK